MGVAGMVRQEDVHYLQGSFTKKQLKVMCFLLQPYDSNSKQWQLKNTLLPKIFC